jgi:hypothetical protein
MKEPRRHCWHNATRRINGAWYCGQHHPPKSPPVDYPIISPARLRELEELSQQVNPDARLYTKTCREEFPRLIQEIRRLQNKLWPR